MWNFPLIAFGGQNVSGWEDTSDLGFSDSEYPITSKNYACILIFLFLLRFTCRSIWKGESSCLQVCGCWYANILLL